MINFEALKQGLLLQDYGVGIFSNLIEAKYSQQLMQVYPQSGFKSAQLYIPESRIPSIIAANYAVDVCQFIPEKMKSSLWFELVTILESEKYRYALGKKMNLDLSKAKTKIEFCDFKHHHFIAPHYDTEENKILTQIFYFNPVWGSDWGGELVLLDSSEPHVPIFFLPPLAIYSAVILPSAKAWHEVRPVTELAQQSRKSLQLLFFEEPLNTSDELANHNE